MKQYIENSQEQEQPKGFNKTGTLLLKNLQDKIEYHLYNNKLPYSQCMESVDINETLRLHIFSSVNSPIHISIVSDNELIIEGIGKLKRKIINNIEKFYLTEVNSFTDANYFNPVFSHLEENDGIEYIVTDLELLMFDLVDLMINIKINTVRNEESDEVEEGNTENETKYTN